jgi:hypothetical protein
MLKKRELPPELKTALKEAADGASASAYKIISEFAVDGWPAAQVALGMALAKGEVLERDFKHALEMFHKAAEQDDREAQCCLGYAYLNGSGVNANQTEALAWFILAATHDHPDALQERDRGLAALSENDRYRAINRARNLGPEPAAGWSRDSTNGTRVWLPSWFRLGDRSIEIDVPAVDGKAHGQGKIVLKDLSANDSARVYEGVFSEGYYFGSGGRPKGEFHFLPSDDFLYRLPDSKDVAYRGIAFWLRVDFGVDIAARPCYVATNRTPDVVASVPDFFPVHDDKIAKAVLIEAARRYLEVCPDNLHAKLTLVPSEFEFGEDRFGHRIFVPRLASGSFYREGDQVPLANFDNHARQDREEAERKLEEAREREVAEEKKRAAAAAAQTRDSPDIRGIRLGMTLDELHDLFEGEIAEWNPRWDPDRTLPSYRQFEQSIRLADGARVSATFASPVNGSVLFAVAYEQYLRDGPSLEKLVADLEAKYGKPDDTGGGGAWWSYELLSRVEEVLGAFLKVNFSVERKTKKVDRLRIIINDAGFGSYDEHAATSAEREAKQRAFEANKSDEVKF